MTDAINSHSRRMYNAQKNTRADLEATASPSIATPLDDPRVKALVEALQEYACDCGDACEQLNGTCGDTARAALSALEETND
jgi:hypothetical protein